MTERESGASSRDLHDVDLTDVARAVSRGLPSHADVDDAVQAAMVRAWLEIEDGRALYSPKGWLVRAARNIAIDNLRRRAAEERAIRMLAMERPIDLRSGVDLSIGLASVPARQREVLLLHYVEGLKLADIAVRLGVTVGTVKSQLHRGRRALATALGSSVEEEVMTAGRTGQGWFLGGSNAMGSYKADVEPGMTPGENALVLRSRTGSPAEGFSTVMQMISARRFRDRRVRFSAECKATGVRGWGGLWMRVDPRGGGRALAFDNMERRPISGDGAWERHDVVLDVSPDADSIHFGALLAGGGELRLRALSFEVVSDDTPTTGDEPEYPDEPVNLDLASPISP